MKKRHFHHILTTTLLSSILLFSGQVLSQTAEEKGLEIATEAQNRDKGFHDSQAEMKMVLKNKHGDTSIRLLRSKTLEVDGDGDKSLSIFDQPADVKGTAFLTWSHGLKPDQQWIYLPALKRVKRIASRNKSGPFMGSEFAYEDLSSQEVEKYHYKYIKDDVIDGHKTWVIERYPAYKHSGYTKIVTWIDQDRYVALKIVFYDRKGALLKTLTFGDYKQYLGKYWRPTSMHMVNHQNGKATDLYFMNYRFQTGLSSKDFRKNALKRLR